MHNHVLKTPLLVPIPEIFEKYLARASKRTRYEYRHAPVLNHREIAFDRELVRHWMAVWEQQPIAGGYPRWHRYTPERFEGIYNQGILKVFYCDIGLQMVEVCDDYVYCHPPLYDKKNPIAKAMWFALIKAFCGKVSWIDLGGGSGTTWDKLERKGYKWLYVPKDIERKPWKVQVCSCGWRQLIVEVTRCRCTPGR